MSEKSNEKQISLSPKQLSEELLARYDNARAVRTLVQLIPFGIGGAVDIWFTESLERIRKERAQIFFDRLASDEVRLTEEVIKSDEFLHCFFLTSKAALNSRRREKIELLASLLSSTFSRPEHPDFDEYEELIQILENITWREWRALNILDRFTNTPMSPSDNLLQWSLKFWNTFVGAIEAELGIPQNEIIPFLTGISRTGLYVEISGGFMDYSGGVGYLSPRFQKLKELVQSAST